MGHFLRIAVLVLLSHLVTAQSNLFAPYDCRGEIVNEQPKEKEMVRLDFSDLDSLLQRSGDQIAFELTFGEDTDWKTWKTSNNYEFGKDRGDLIMISDLRALHPFLRDRVSQLIRICKAKGITLAIVETYRTHAKQHEYKTMGTRFTRSGAGKSNHQYGLAVDVVPIVNGKAEWHNLALWRRIGITGERLGLRWGGRWRSIFDPGHFEWTGGLKTEEIASGSIPRVPYQSQRYPCLDEDLEQLARYWNAWEAMQGSFGITSSRR